MSADSNLHRSRRVSERSRYLRQLGCAIRQGDGVFKRIRVEACQQFVANGDRREVCLGRFSLDERERIGALLAVLRRNGDGNHIIGNADNNLLLGVSLGEGNHGHSRCAVRQGDGIIRRLGIKVLERCTANVDSLEGSVVFTLDTEVDSITTLVAILGSNDDRHRAIQSCADAVDSLVRITRLKLNERQFGSTLRQHVGVRCAVRVEAVQQQAFDIDGSQGVDIRRQDIDLHAIHSTVDTILSQHGAFVGGTQRCSNRVDLLRLLPIVALVELD